MLCWPHRRVESTPPSAFSPPHCPWACCPSQHPSTLRPFRFHRFGSFRRLGDRRLVPRFRCLSCLRTFSLQTFAFSYYLKRPELSEAVASGIVAGSAHRQIARSVKCCAGTVTRRAARLGRHAILLLLRALKAVGPLREPVLYDDFESFVSSQDLPFGMGTAVGKHSSFVYGLEQAPHARGGRLTQRQRARLAGRPRPPARAYRKALERLLDLLVAMLPHDGRLELLTDEHRAYRSAVRNHPLRHRIEHRSYRNPPRRRKDAPSSAETRHRDRQLHEVDVLHRLIRHSEAHHRRETIAFGQRLEDVVGRGFVLAVWRNFIKSRWENRPREGTPAMRLGLSRGRWDWSTVLSRRLFRHRLEVPEGWRWIWERSLRWPDPGTMRVLELKNAG